MHKILGTVLSLGLALSILGQVAPAHAEIDVATAIKIALERVPGRVEEVERDHERGKPVFEVDILGDDGVEYEVTIDANDGSVISVQRD